jgi:hypothetical protein
MAHAPSTPPLPVPPQYAAAPATPVPPVATTEPESNAKRESVPPPPPQLMALLADTPPLAYPPVGHVGPVAHPGTNYANAPGAPILVPSYPPGPLPGQVLPANLAVRETRVDGMSGIRAIVGGVARKAANACMRVARAMES